MLGKKTGLEQVEFLIVTPFFIECSVHLQAFSMRLVCAPRCFQIARYQDRVYLTLSLVLNCPVAARMNGGFVQVP